MQQQVKRDAAEAKQTLKKAASQLADQAKASAKDQATVDAKRAADEADKLSAAVKAAAQALEDEDREGMASYVRRLGDGMSTFAHRLQERNSAGCVLGSLSAADRDGRSAGGSGERRRHGASETACSRAVRAWPGVGETDSASGKGDGAQRFVQQGTRLCLGVNSSDR